MTAVTFQAEMGKGEQFAYLYTYNQAGRVTGQRVRVVQGSSLIVDRSAGYGWDNEGKMTSLTYPDGATVYN